MKETGHELKDVGHTLSWGALDSFLSHVGPESALMAEINPDVSEWSSTMKTNAILADIYDALMTINANFMSYATRKPGKRPKPYPRPNRPDNENERHFGRGALPPDELRKWFEKKRAERCQK